MQGEGVLCGCGLPSHCSRIVLKYFLQIPFVLAVLPQKRRMLFQR